MVAVRMYVEGGGDSSAQRTEFRQGLAAFWENAGLKLKMPRTIVCGSRNSAYSDFCVGLRTHPNEVSILLVDSEDPYIYPNLKWPFLFQRDGWRCPPGATEDNVFLMVQTMEAWLLADREALAEYYGQQFNARALPSVQTPVETLSKNVMYSSLANATQMTRKGTYSKGGHSFKLVALIAPQKVMNASPSAMGLIAHLTKIL